MPDGRFACAVQSVAWAGIVNGIALDWCVRGGSVVIVGVIGVWVLCSSGEGSGGGTEGGGVFAASVVVIVVVCSGLVAEVADVGVLSGVERSEFWVGELVVVEISSQSSQYSAP